MWSTAVILITFFIVKIATFFLGKLEKEKKAKEQETEISEFSVPVLIKSILPFLAGFIALIIILEIFNFRLITAVDLKIIGIIALKIVGIVFAAKITIKFGRAFIRRTFSGKGLTDGLFDKGRAYTLEILLINTLTYIVFFLAGLTILQLFNVNTSAILASAGIIGLAVGFGAQNLVKDVISGFFIIFENQFSVGDFVEVAGVIGTTEEIGLRTSKIRKWSGELHIIPNGEITKVTNYNRGLMIAQVIIGIAYEENVDEVLNILRKECQQAFDDIPDIKEIPVVQGVIALSNFSVDIRIVAKTTPGEQWAVERELRRRFKNVLERENIEIPYPKSVVQLSK